MSKQEITYERVKEILTCYGGSPKAWPDEERPGALSLLETSAELQKLQAEALQLDHAMELGNEEAIFMKESPESSLLAERIISQLPKPGVSVGSTTQKYSAVNFFLSRFISLPWWSGVVVTGAVTALLTIGLFSQPPNVIDNRQSTAVATNEFEDWAWEEVLDQNSQEPVNNTNVETLAMLVPESIPLEQ